MSGSLAQRCRQAGDAYFMALEHLGVDIGIELGCDLRRPVDPAALLSAFELLLRRHPALCRQRRADPAGAGWTWEPLDIDEALQRWRPMAEALAQGRTVDATGWPWVPVQVQAGHLRLRADHSFANGRAAFAWLARLLELVHGEAGAPPVAASPAARRPAALLGGLLQYTGQALARRAIGAHRRDPGLPLRPKAPRLATGVGAWAVRHWSVDRASLQAHLGPHGLARGASWTESLSQSISQHLFARFPELAGLPLQWAIDLHQDCGVPLQAEGNYTALVSTVVDREQGEQRLANLMQSVRRGLASCQADLIGLQARGRAAMIRWFGDRLWPRADGSARPTAMDPVLMVSNVGRLDEVVFEHHVERAWLWTRTPMIYLACTTVGEQCTLSLSFPSALYDEPRVLDAFDSWTALLARSPLPAQASPDAHPLTARHFQLDLQDGVDLNWNRSGFRSQFFNSVSLLLPAGERWIIDTVRRTIDTLPAPARAHWSVYGREFIMQESIHRATHRRCNELLTAQGLQDWIGGKVEQRVVWGERGTPINQLASSVTFEYVTTLFCGRVIRDPSWLDDSDPRLARLWMWHVCEELEHKHFVLDLFRAAGGGEWRRIAWFIWFSSSFMKDLHVQLYLSLRSAGLLWRWDTWRDAARFYFGRRGMAWLYIGGSLRFLNPWFEHPGGAEDRLARQWFDSNAQTFVESRPAAAAA